MNRNDAPPIDITPPFDWTNARSEDDRNWHGQLHMWRMLDPYFLAYFETADPDFLKPAMDVARDWNTFHLKQQKPSSFAWRDGMVGVRSMKLAALWELLPAHRPELDDLWLSHAEWALAPGNIRTNNHGLIDAHGAMALVAVRPEAPVSPNLKAHALERITTALAAQFDAGGFHKEHSPEYHFFAMRYLSMFLSSGWYDDASQIQRLAESALAASEWLRFPDNRYLPFGDSTTAPPKSYGKVQKSGGVSVAGSGYAIFRSDWETPPEDASCVAMFGASHSETHNHADDLSFVWYDAGLDIITDSGKFAYANSDIAKYFRSPRSHNTVQIRGDEPPTPRKDFFGVAKTQVAREAYGARLSGMLVKDYEHNREILIAPGRALIVIDRLASHSPQSFDSWLNLAPEIDTVIQHDDRIAALLPTGRPLTMKVAASVPVSVSIARGQQDPLRGWASRAYGHSVPAWSICVQSEPATRLTLVTAIAIGPDMVSEISVPGRVAAGPISTSVQGAAPCPTCKGDRFVLSLYAPGEFEACPDCEGEGTLFVNERVDTVE